MIILWLGMFIWSLRPLILLALPQNRPLESHFSSRLKSFLTVVVVDVRAHYPHGAVSDLPRAVPLVLPGDDPQRLPVLQENYIYFFNTGCPICSWTWVGLTLILVLHHLSQPGAAASTKFPSSQAESVEHSQSKTT